MVGIKIKYYINNNKLDKSEDINKLKNIYTYTGIIHGIINSMLVVLTRCYK